MRIFLKIILIFVGLCMALVAISFLIPTPLDVLGLFVICPDGRLIFGKLNAETTYEGSLEYNVTNETVTCQEHLYMLESHLKCVDYVKLREAEEKKYCMNDFNSSNEYAESRMVLRVIEDKDYDSAESKCTTVSKIVACGCQNDDDMTLLKSKPLVYDSHDNACYRSFTQEACEDSHWLVPVGNGQHDCILNACLNSDIEDSQVVLYNETCVRLGEDCGSTPEMGNDNVYQLHSVTGMVVCLPDEEQIYFDEEDDLPRRVHATTWTPRKKQSLIMRPRKKY